MLRAFTLWEEGTLSETPLKFMFTLITILSVLPLKENTGRAVLDHTCLVFCTEEFEKVRR